MSGEVYRETIQRRIDCGLSKNMLVAEVGEHREDHFHIFSFGGVSFVVVSFVV